MRGFSLIKFKIRARVCLDPAIPWVCILSLIMPLIPPIHPPLLCFGTGSQQTTFLLCQRRPVKFRWQGELDRDEKAGGEKKKKPKNTFLLAISVSSQQQQTFITAVALVPASNFYFYPQTSFIMLPQRYQKQSDWALHQWSDPQSLSAQLLFFFNSFIRI